MTNRGSVFERGSTTPALTRAVQDIFIIESLEPLRVRRMTPKERFRLQGWSDDYYNKAQLVNSDKQLMMQAGNGVTVRVVEVIGKHMDILA